MSSTINAGYLSRFKPGDSVMLESGTAPVLDYNVLRGAIQQNDPVVQETWSIFSSSGDVATQTPTSTIGVPSKLALPYSGNLGLEGTFKQSKTEHERLYFWFLWDGISSQTIGTNSRVVYSEEEFKRVNLERLANEKSRFVIQGNPINGDWRDVKQIIYIRRGNLMLPIHVNQYRQSSTWVEFRDSALIPFASAALSFIPGVSAAVGQFILGPSLSATYPALASGLGSISVTSVMNGGDVLEAAQNYLNGFIGRQLGIIIDIPVLSNVASSVSTAFLRGGDVEKALVSGIISGLSQQSQAQFQTTVTGGNVENYSDADYDYGGGWSSDYVDPVSYSDADYGYGDYWSSDFADPVSYSDADYGYGDYWTDTPAFETVNYSDADAGYGDAWSTGGDYVAPVNYSDADAGYGESPVSSGWNLPDFSGITFDSVLANLPRLIQTGLQINAAVRGQTSQPIRSGGSTTVSANGRMMNGQMPTAGQVFQTADGRAVVNNGDGTYTIVGADGQAIIRSYSTNQVTQKLPKPAGSGDKTLLYAGLGVGAAFLLKKMKG